MITTNIPLTALMAIGHAKSRRKATAPAATSEAAPAVKSHKRPAMITRQAMRLADRQSRKKTVKQVNDEAAAREQASVERRNKIKRPAGKLTEEAYRRAVRLMNKKKKLYHLPIPAHK